MRANDKDFIVYQVVSESPLRLDQVIPTDGLYIILRQMLKELTKK